MLRRVAFLIALCLVLGFEQRSFAQGSLGAELPSDSMLARFGLQRTWWGHATLDPFHDRVEYFNTDEQATFVQSDSGMLTAFDNTAGRRMWYMQVGATTEVRHSLVTNDQLAFVVSGTTMYALDKKKGDVYWQVKVPSAPSTSPGIDDTRIFVGGANGALYAYQLKVLDDLTKGHQWSKYGYRALDWTYKTGGRIAFAPISTGSTVCVASTDGSVYGLDMKEKKIKFQMETQQPLSAPIAQLGSRIFLATQDLKVYCVDADAGRLKWELLTGLEVRERPRVIGDHLFIRAEGNGLHCLSAATGRELWANLAAGSFLAATPTVVYVSDDSGNVQLLNHSDGHRVGMFALPRFTNRIANDRTDRLYFASERGLVLSLREREREFPLFHRVPEKRPVLPEVAPEDGTQKPAKPTASAKKPKKDEAADDDADAKKAKADTDEGAMKPPPAKKAPSKPLLRKPKKPPTPPKADNE